MSYGELSPISNRTKPESELSLTEQDGETMVAMAGEIGRLHLIIQEKDRELETLRSITGRWIGVFNDSNRFFNSAPAIRVHPR